MINFLSTHSASLCHSLNISSKNFNMSGKNKIIAAIALAVFSLYAIFLIVSCYLQRDVKIFKEVEVVRGVVKSPNTLLDEKQIGETKIVLLEGDLMLETTDAIVNAANNMLIAGNGVCGEVHRHAGSGVFYECAEILKREEQFSIPCGRVVLTSAGALFPRVKGIIHAVGPDCSIQAENDRRSELLAEAYLNSLELLIAPQKDLKVISPQIMPAPMYTIAFPSISTGIYGFPLEEASQIALETIKNFIESHPGELDEVRLVFLPLDKDPKTSPAYVNALKNL